MDINDFQTLSYVAAENEQLKEEYDKAIIAVSFGIAFIGSYLATSITEQLRLSYVLSAFVTHQHVTRWYVLMGLAMGAVGLWGTHIIGLSAMRVYTEQGDQVPLYYAVGMTVISLILVCITTTVAMIVSSYDPMYLKTKTELIEQYIPESVHMSAEQINMLKKKKIPWIIATKELWYLLFGGLIQGFGAVGMHYVGVQSLRFQGHFHFEANEIVASIFVAVIGSLITFWMIFRLLSLYPYREGLRVLCSITMALICCGIHYVGMKAANLQYGILNNRTIKGRLRTSQVDAFHPTLVAALGLCAIIVIAILADLRKLTNRYLNRMKPALDRRNIKTLEMIKSLSLFQFTSSLSSIMLSWRSDAKVFVGESSSQTMSQHVTKDSTHVSAPSVGSNVGARSMTNKRTHQQNHYQVSSTDLSAVLEGPNPSYLSTNNNGDDSMMNDLEAPNAIRPSNSNSGQYHFPPRSNLLRSISNAKVEIYQSMTMNHEDEYDEEGILRPRTHPVDREDPQADSKSFEEGDSADRNHLVGIDDSVPPNISSSDMLILQRANSMNSGFTDDYSIN